MTNANSLFERAPIPADNVILIEWKAEGKSLSISSAKISFKLKLLLDLNGLGYSGGDETSQSWRKSTLNIHWTDWCWSSNTLATWCKEPTHWKRPWCWERLRARAEGDNRGWNGWMASPTQWTWVWANSGRWWRTGKPGVLQSMGSQAVRQVLATEQQFNL